MDIWNMIKSAGKLGFNFTTIGAKQFCASQLQDSMRRDIKDLRHELDEGYEQYIKPNFNMLKDK